MAGSSHDLTSSPQTVFHTLLRRLLKHGRTPFCKLLRRNRKAKGQEFPTSSPHVLLEYQYSTIEGLLSLTTTICLRIPVPPAVVRFLSSLSYTFTLVRLVAGFNLGANAPPCINVYIYALFTCATSPPHCVLPSNLHHYHKVLQHIEVLC